MTLNAREAGPTWVSEDYFEVKVDERAVGRANKRLLEILAEHFNVPKSGISTYVPTGSRDRKNFEAGQVPSIGYD